MTSKIAFQIAAGILLLSALLSLSSSQELATQPPPIETMADLEALFAHEPSYGAIQQAAMRYAEVHPEKIASWRTGAQFRAFLPRIQFRYDLDTMFEDATSLQTEYSQSFEFSQDFETNVSTDMGINLERGEAESQRFEDGIPSVFGEEWSEGQEWTVRRATSSSTRYADGENYGETESSGYFDKDGKRKDWGVRLEWDLRDFLYNDEQPRISREARELVELRQDVLEEVNTYFFDRRRAQIELIFSPPSDTRSKIDLQLRIARLTANIDALSGGYLSKQLEEAQTGR